MPKLIPNVVWDALQSEVAFLRSQVAAKVEHTQRIERVTVGLPELPAKPPEKIGPMPESLANVVDSYEAGPVRESLRKSFYEMRKKLGSWDAVEVEVARQMELES